MEPLDVSPQTWWISLAINLVMIPLSYYLFKVYLPAQIEKRKKEVDAELERENERLKSELEAKHDNREYFQASGNLAAEVLERILREAIKELSGEIDKLTESWGSYQAGVSRSMSYQAKQIEALRGSVRQLIGVIEEIGRDANKN